VRLPAASLVVLIGPSGSGKSTWASHNFRPDQVVSSDALRALVGTAESDQRAGTDAFNVLDLVLERRLARGLLTVVDTLGLDAERRRGYLALAQRRGIPAYAVMFDTAAEVCRSRNRATRDPVPAKVLADQIRRMKQAVVEVADEGFAAVHSPEAVEVVAGSLLGAPAHAERQHASPVRLDFGLQLSSFAWAGGGASLAPSLAEVATVAEAVGFSSIWVMDHVIQIPQVGRPWEDIPESWTTLAWLAAKTTTARLGTLVTGVTLRNPAHLAKIVATADVLSGGRVTCGLGAAWWEHEHQAYGWSFPTAGERFALLEDTLQLLPLMWGPGSPPFEGRVIRVAEAVCYPRPLQDHVPILVGGSGERRTLRLAATYADACNLRGDPETVRRKRAVLLGHCEAVGRDPSDVRVTHLSTAAVARSARERDALVERLRPRSMPPEAIMDGIAAGTVEEQIGRYRELADAGVQTAIVSLLDVTTPGTLETFAAVIKAFA
jgi:F420-dependent oxidoreductase-like protein